MNQNCKKLTALMSVVVTANFHDLIPATMAENSKLIFIVLRNWISKIFFLVLGNKVCLFTFFSKVTKLNMKWEPGRGYLRLK